MEKNGSDHFILIIFVFKWWFCFSRRKDGVSHSSMWSSTLVQSKEAADASVDFHRCQTTNWRNAQDTQYVQVSLILKISEDLKELAHFKEPVVKLCDPFNQMKKHLINPSAKMMINQYLGLLFSFPMEVDWFRARINSNKTLFYITA